MQTGLQLFRYDRRLTACALGEPSLTLVRNDSEFGLLIATGAHEDSFWHRNTPAYRQVRSWIYPDVKKTSDAQ